MPRKRTPLKEMRFRIALAAVSVVLAVAVAGIVASLLEHRGVDAGYLWTSIVSALVVIVIGVPLGLLLGRKIVGDRLEMAIREPGQTKWRHGRLDVEPGRISMRFYRFQMRWPAGEPVVFQVESMSEDIGRRPSLKQLWSINPTLHIVTLETDRGPREVAGLPSHLVELRERLGAGLGVGEPAASS